MLSRLKQLFVKKSKSTEQNKQSDWNELKLSGDIRDNVNRLMKIMNCSSDLITREFCLAGSKRKAAVLFISTLVQEDIVQDHILKPLIIESASLSAKNQDNLEDIKDTMMSAQSIRTAESFDDIVLAIMSGDTFVTIQGFAKGLIIESKGYQGRTIGEPATEPSVKGPQEAFVEILKINIGLIRRRVRDPNICFESLKIGRRAKADYVIVYVKGIVNPTLVEEVRKRMSELDLDGQATTSQVMRMVAERPNTVFPLIQVTERPDKVVSALSEGRIAIIMDGSPDAVIVPVTLPILIQSAEDYFENWVISSVIRTLRYLALFATALFPALYIAITSFHPGMLPTTLTLSIARTRSGVPFPAFLEALLMVFTLEMLNEAGIRLPRVVGQTISIVGGLVIGQAAVQAGVVSPIMVIVISITAVASYTIPDYSLGMAMRILRVPFMILAVVLGSFGVAIGLLMGLVYLASLKSFGVCYLEPISTRYPEDWKDTFYRGSLWNMRKRPMLFHPKDTTRLAKKQKS